MTEPFHRYDAKLGPVESEEQPLEPALLRPLGSIHVSTRKGLFLWDVYVDDRTKTWWTKRGKNGCES